MLFQTRNGIGIPTIETFPELGAAGCSACQKNGVSLGRLGAGNVVQLQSQIPGANLRGPLGLDPEIAAAVTVQRAINAAAKALNIQPGSEGGFINDSTLALAKRVIAAAANLALSGSTKAVLVSIVNLPNGDAFDTMIDQSGPAIVTAFGTIAALAIDEVRHRPPGMPMAAKVALGLGLAGVIVAVAVMARR